MHQEPATLELLVLLLQPGVVRAQVEPVHGRVLQRPAPAARRRLPPQARGRASDHRMQGCSTGRAALP
eukprot:2765359-Lingulodinium_polyedra.AAC.1